MAWCSKENMQKYGLIFSGFIGLLLFILCMLGLIRYHQKMKLNEPLFTFTYLDLSENTSKENVDKFNYHIKPSDNNISFSLSFWIYIYNSPNNLEKGNTGFDNPTIIFSMPINTNAQSPYMSYYQKTGEIFMNIYDDPDRDEPSHYNLGYLKQQTWSNVIIRLTNRNLDYFLNGKIEKSFILKNVPIIGTNTIKFGDKGGGYMLIAIPRYYNRVITVQEIQRLYKDKKNSDIPIESLIGKLCWWIPCLRPECWSGLNQVLPL